MSIKEQLLSCCLFVDVGWRFPKHLHDKQKLFVFAFPGEDREPNE
jgi:hypothetical protein